MTAGMPVTVDSMTPNSDVRLWTLSLRYRSESVMFGSHGDGMAVVGGYDPLELELKTLTVIQSRVYFCTMIINGKTLNEYAISTGSTKNQPCFRRRRQHLCLELSPSASSADCGSRSATSATSSVDVIVAYCFRSRGAFSCVDRLPLYKNAIYTRDIESSATLRCRVGSGEINHDTAT